MDPEKLVAFVQHADETAEAGVFGFEQGVEFAQVAFSARSQHRVRCWLNPCHQFVEGGAFASDGVNHIFAETDLILQSFVGGLFATWNAEEATGRTKLNVPVTNFK